MGGSNLRHSTLGGTLVGPPPQQSGAVTETRAGYLIEAHFHHKRRLQRLPFGGPFVVPAAWPTGRLAGEARRRAQFLQTLGQRRTLLVANRGGEADMVQLALAVV